MDFATSILRRQAGMTPEELAAITAAMVTKPDPAPIVVPAIWSMVSFATLFLALRVYLRFSKSKLWWDDYLLIVGWVFLIISTSLITRLMKMEFGLTLFFTPRMHTISTTNDVFNRVSLALTKTSFAIMLLRVATGWQRWMIWGLLISMNIIMAVNCITTWMPACDRLALGDAYEAFLPGTCWQANDSVIMAMVSNSFSAFVDFALALLPWKIIMNLQMKRHEQLGVAIAMSLGLVAGSVGIVKVTQIWSLTGGIDIPYRLSMLFIWGQAEPSATIIATSIPVLRVLFRDMQRSRYGTSGANHYIKSDHKSKFPDAIAMDTLDRDKGGPDDGSDINILPSQGQTPPKNGIIQTRDIRVEYDARSHHEGPDDVENGFARHRNERGSGTATGIPHGFSGKTSYNPSH